MLIDDLDSESDVRLMSIDEGCMGCIVAGGLAGPTLAAWAHASLVEHCNDCLCSSAAGETPWEVAR